MKEYCFGIDVGGTSVKLGLFHKDGELMDKWEIPTRTVEGGRYILSDIADSIRGKLAEKKISIEDVIGAGIGVPGPVYRNGFVPKCVNLGWKDTNPAQELSQLLSIPAKVDNDANIAALGEMWQGGGAGYEDVVLITLGTGVGGGIIVRGGILNGQRGVAGELGHIVVNTDEQEPCKCGNCGCLEQYASATGVVRVAHRLIANSTLPSVLRDKESFTAKDVFDCAKANDPLAREAADMMGKYLGQALAAVTLTVDPDVIVLGGGVSRAGQILIDITTKYLNMYTSIAVEKPKIVLAKLGNDAGIYGGAKLALQ